MLATEVLEKYQPVVGLEVHIQLNLQSKMFSTEGFAFGASPNQYVSPITLSHPGALPQINQQAIFHAIKLGLALDCDIRSYHFFDRKNYFYPDLPKGYQITQDRIPVCGKGKLEIPISDHAYREIGIHHIHLEEDAGKSIHDLDATESSIDLNRCGVALIELVSEPEMYSAAEAAAFLSSVRRLVRYLEISDGDMEKGSLRCDANVSVRPQNVSELGQRVEIKNMNSISFLSKAIEYEVARQVDLIESGGSIQQETRTWDIQNLQTLPMRDKETADDYRYFPEPDLLPIKISEEEIRKIHKTLPVLPQNRLRTYREEYGISKNEAYALVEQKAFSDYYEALVQTVQSPQIASNWMLGPVKTWLNESGSHISDFPLPPEQMKDLIQLVEDGKVNRNQAQTSLFEALIQQPDQSPVELASRLDLYINTNKTEIESQIEALILAHPDELARYKKGKKGLLGFFVGQLMRQLKGKADPKQINRMFQEKLDNWDI